MSSKLEKLIAHHEKEHAALRNQIDECLEEMEYKTAHRLTKGLFLVSETLRTLHILQDKLYDDKEGIKRRLVIYNDRLNKEVSGHMRDY